MMIEGIANWASITQPNTRFEPKYCIDVVLTDDKAQELKDEGYTIKDKSDGPTITINRKVNGPNGRIREAPELVDAQKNTLNCLVGNGSKVKVLVRAWEMNRNGQDFKGLELLAVQVVKLVPYEPQASDSFDVIEADEEEVVEL
tara:strand:- start:1672 stop:2103 length:432 start_codon:yes stop_codon:yes gene_type:complete